MKKNKPRFVIITNCMHLMFYMCDVYIYLARWHKKSSIIAINDDVNMIFIVDSKNILAL
jgi:hypothetical protein